MAGVRRRKVADDVSRYPEWYRGLMQSGLSELEQLRTLRLACCIRESSGGSVDVLERLGRQHADIVKVLEGVYEAVGRLGGSGGVEERSADVPTEADVDAAAARILKRLGPVARRQVYGARDELLSRMRRGVNPTREGVERLLGLMVEEQLSVVEESMSNRRHVVGEDGEEE